MARKYRKRIDWYWLRSITETSLNESDIFPLPVVVDGKMDWIESGLYHDNYRFRITGVGLPGEWKEKLLLLRLSKHKNPPLSLSESGNSLLREAKTLRILKQTGIQFETAEYICMVQTEDNRTVGLVETWLRGIPLHSYKQSIYHDRIIPTIARAAASVHRLKKEPFGYMKAAEISKNHILEELGDLSPELFNGFPAVQEAREWILSRLSDNRPSVVLHGDLLPQNILCREIDGDWRVAIIDWQFARIGDPAYDLAIVTRGDRKLLGINNSLALIVEAYLQAGGTALTVSDVRVHELILMLNWLKESVEAMKENRRRGHGPEYYEQRLASLLRRENKQG